MYVEKYLIMKTKLNFIYKLRIACYILFIFCSSSKISYCQFINSKFDDWIIVDTDEPYEDLIGWNTSNYNDFGGFKNVSVEKIELNSGDYQAKIESKQGTIDALISGDISQKINLSDIQRINYRSKCDSLAGLGYCLVKITLADESTNLFTDTIWLEDDTVKLRSIEIDPSWIDEYDEIILYFEAFGYVFNLVPEMMAYSVFIVDEVEVDFISNLYDTSIQKSIVLYPNPTRNNIRIEYNGYEKICGVQLISNNGRIINSFDGSIRQISTEDLPDGVYIIRLQTVNGSIVTKKIVVN